MKILLTALLLAFASLTVAKAQGLPADSATHKVTYRGTTALPSGVTPSQAFGRAKIWLADAFTSKAILADDASSGLLSGAGTVRVNSFIYSFRIRLQVEASQVKYRLDDFIWQTDGSRGPADHGTAEEQRDSKMAIGKGSRAKMLAELDQKVRAGLAQLGTELAGTL